MTEQSPAPVYLNSIGIVCALGADPGEVAARLFSGDRGARTHCTLADQTCLPFAPVVDALPEIPLALCRYRSRNLALVLAALARLEDEIRRAVERYGAERVAVVMGTSTSGISEGENVLRHADVREGGALPADFDFQRQEVGSVAESIAIHCGVAGPALTVSTACSSGAKALAVARRLVRQDLADMVIAGGADSACALTVNGFQALSALSRDACLPFSRNRDGTLIGEGAALFLVSREPRGPELCGVGESSDGHNMTAPEPGGRGAAAAMSAALADARIAAGDVAYVNLHGTGTALNDAMEGRALTDLGLAATACSSSKGQIGHTLGAAGAVEAALCWLTLECNPAARLPPHLWDGDPDPDAAPAGLTRVDDPLPARERLYLMSNSYAFGGSNVALVLGENRAQ